MVKITNGIGVFEVTQGAYEGIYKHQGYQIVGEKAEQNFGAEVSGQKDERTADEMFIEELEEKPVSQWNKDEVKRYAAIKGIDLSGTKNVNEAKEIIKQVMNGDDNVDGNGEE